MAPAPPPVVPFGGHAAARRPQQTPPTAASAAAGRPLVPLADFVSVLPRRAAILVFARLDLRSRTRLERVSRHWRTLVLAACAMETKPVWVYIIFRKNRCSGHEKMTVNMSFDGPIFWNRQVAYIYCCSCHFDEHEGPLIALFQKFEQRVERVCLVDKPLDYAFLPDHFFSYMAEKFPRLQFIYARELDLEKINRGTVVQLANHPNLKKLIVHGCRNYEVLEDFHSLPQLLVVKGEIQGLKVMLGDCFYMDDDTSLADSSSSSNTASYGETSQATAITPKHQPNGVHGDGVDAEENSQQQANGSSNGTETAH